MTKTTLKITKADPGWTMYLPRQPGNEILIERPVMHWCVDDGETWPYDACRLTPVVIAAVRHVSDARYLIQGDVVPFDGLAERLRSMIEARHIAAGRMKP